jgi:hypothetical protein
MSSANGAEDDRSRSGANSWRADPMAFPTTDADDEARGACIRSCSRQLPLSIQEDFAGVVWLKQPRHLDGIECRHVFSELCRYRLVG